MRATEKDKDRLDKILMDKGFAKSREIAKAFIMAGKVLVEGKIVLKAGTNVKIDSAISLKEKDMPYVSRGGMKLDAAINFFSIDTSDKIIMDIGCSTGGFTDCVLKKNARKVYAVDVGHGQFDWSLRHDPRIKLMERTNIRYLDRDLVNDDIDICVIDVSFISLLKVLPKAYNFLGQAGEVIALVKPQFEVGRALVGKGGVVRDKSARLSATDIVRSGAEKIGFSFCGVFESPVKGQKGNIEYFIYLRKK